MAWTHWIRQLSCLLLIGVSCSAGAQLAIKGLRIWPAPDSTRLVFDLTGPAKYKVHTLSHPHRVVVDFEAAKFNPTLKDVHLDNSPITRIRTGKPNPKRFRVVFEVTSALKTKSFSLTPNQRYGHRLVVDLTTADKQAILSWFGGKPNTDSRLPPVFGKKDKYVVAIDAGHGGEDPGAIGPNGVLEKEVVLAIAKRLHRIINQTRHIEAHLLRSGDYYLGLRERMIRARRLQADLFVSLHADAYKTPKAKGASVYVLSTQGASSEAARWLAEDENQSDTIGGVSLDDKSPMLASVLLDLSQTANAHASLKAAKHILQAMGQAVRLHKPKVERGGFAVLKAPDIPSILVEVGFLSHPPTEKLLGQSAHQQSIAMAVATGVKAYLKGQPLARQQGSRQAVGLKFRKHKVRAGDSLSKLAKKYRCSIAQLRSWNRLKNDKIMQNQWLIVAK